ncbi:UNVERIFIED_CONTAM: hypothetical protein FKN15_041998 [Acipenser sinensis]
MLHCQPNPDTSTSTAPERSRDLNPIDHRRETRRGRCKRGNIGPSLQPPPNCSHCGENQCRGTPPSKLSIRDQCILGPDFLQQARGQLDLVRGTVTFGVGPPLNLAAPTTNPSHSLCGHPGQCQPFQVLLQQVRLKSRAAAENKNSYGRQPHRPSLPLSNPGDRQPFQGLLQGARPRSGEQEQPRQSSLPTFPSPTEPRKDIELAATVCMLVCQWHLNAVLKVSVQAYYFTISLFLSGGNKWVANRQSAFSNEL